MIACSTCRVRLNFSISSYKRPDFSILTILGRYWVFKKELYCRVVFQNMAILGDGGFFTKGIGQKACDQIGTMYFSQYWQAPPPKKSTNFALRTHKNCLLVRFSLGLGFHAVTYTGWISFSVENKHSGSVYSYKSDRMLLHVFPGKNSIFWAFWLKKR